MCLCRPGKEGAHSGISRSKSHSITWLTVAEILDRDVGLFQQKYNNFISKRYQPAAYSLSNDGNNVHILYIHREVVLVCILVLLDI